MSSTYYDLNVSKVVEEATATKSIYFEIPNEHQSHFNFKAGQYLTLIFNVKGHERRRAYSICTPPGAKHIGVTIKRVQSGVVSNFIHDEIKAGSKIQVMIPEGKFIVEPNEELNRDHYFIAAGSGITPVMSMILEILENEPKSMIHLLYGSRDEESIIFRNRLDDLVLKYAGQIKVLYTLSKPKKEKAKGLSGLFKKAETKWEGMIGRIDAEKIKSYLDQNTPRSQTSIFYLCGPGNMIETARNTLNQLNVESDCIKTEYFTNPDQEKDLAAKAEETAGDAKALVHLEGEEIEIVIPSGKTILETLIDQGHDPPFSCTSGACSTCVAKLIKGEVWMEACYALDDDEVEAGFILTCQSHPKTAEVELKYES